MFLFLIHRECVQLHTHSSHRWISWMEKYTGSIQVWPTWKPCASLRSSRQLRGQLFKVSSSWGLSFAIFTCIENSLNCIVIPQSIATLEEFKCLGWPNALIASQTTCGAENGPSRMWIWERKPLFWRKNCGRKQWRREKVGDAQIKKLKRAKEDIDSKEIIWEMHMCFIL